jgi:hypothetical protein
MARLAGYGIEMVIEPVGQRMVLCVRSIIMAVQARDPTLTHRTGGAGACNFVIFGEMTFLTGEVLPAHVNIMRFRRVFQCGVQISVLYGITSAPTPVTGAAIGPAGKSYISSNPDQI